MSQHYQPSSPSSTTISPASGKLVNSYISQQALLVYPSAVKLCRSNFHSKKRDTPPPLRTEITGFSDKSRRSLRFIAGNTADPLISQFCLTYHRTLPDGLTAKKHLNHWLTNLRRHYPDAAYLRVLEFQGRGVPHFHVWLNLPYDLPGLRSFLAESWHRLLTLPPPNI